MECVNLTKQQLVVPQLHYAATFVKRLIGLQGRCRLEETEGLLLTPCKAIHTMFMRFPIDVVFLNESGRVIKLVENRRPYRLGPVVREAHSVLELPAGKLAQLGIAYGDILACRFAEGE